MAKSLAWRNFRRMQDLTLAFASLAYLADAILAWPLLPGGRALKLSIIVFFPIGYLIAVAALTMFVKRLRQVMTRFVWMSFKAGFGQSPISVLASMGVLTLITAYTYASSANAAESGRIPAGVFSGFGAGIGILIVQAVLTHRIQRDPDVQAEVDE